MRSEHNEQLVWCVGSSVRAVQLSEIVIVMSRAKESIRWVVIGLVFLALVPAGLVFLANQDNEDNAPQKPLVEKKVRLKDRTDILSR
jgi:hypothetical protein